MASLLTFALLAATVGPITTSVPLVETAVDALAPSGMRHHEALRIDRDFGKPEFDLVVDAWSDTRRGELADVRLWWAKTTDGNRRSPLSRKSERYVDISTRRVDADRMHVRIRGAGRELELDVELDAEGRAHVYTDVITSDGREIKRCRTTASRLVARRVLGIPVGIGGLNVTCVDPRGREVKARVRMKSARG